MSKKHVHLCCVAYVKFNLSMFAYFLNRVDFFVELSFLMQSISKVPHLIHCFPSEVSQVCKNCQTYDQLLIHQVWTAKNAFLLSLYKEFFGMQVREVVKKSKWKFKMAFAIRGPTPPLNGKISRHFFTPLFFFCN